MSVSEYRRLQRIYRWYAPAYDALFHRMFASTRRRSIDALRLKPTDSVLIVAAGTGLDLPLLPPGGRVVALDMNHAMLARAMKKQRPIRTDFILGDAQRMPFREGVFDAGTLHLILAVAPDGAAVLAETTRVVRSGGSLAVLDKFAEGDPSRVRRIGNVVARALGTNITRDFAAMFAGLPLTVERSEPAMRGFYRITTLRRDARVSRDQGDP